MIHQKEWELVSVNQFKLHEVWISMHYHQRVPYSRLFYDTNGNVESQTEYFKYFIDRYIKIKDLGTNQNYE